MHAAFNYRFAEKLPEYKLSYIEAHSPSALRRVHEFVVDVRKSPLSVAADRHYVTNVMRPWSVLYA